MARLTVMAHYDPQGVVAPHVRRQVEAVAAATDTLIVVSTADLGEAERAWVSARARLVVRENVGYDFLSYKTGLDLAGDLTAYDEVVLCNDSFIGPLRPYSAIFDEMSTRPVDFWGLTGSQRVSPHVQSFFVVFRPWVVKSAAFRRFWAAIAVLDSRHDVIIAYEVGLTTALTTAGFVWGAYYSESPADRRLARRRVVWWALHRRRMPRTQKERAFLLRSMRVPWNPAIGLADVALDDGRLPYVKIDTLRFDPYGLGSERLLELGESHEPEMFDGVRDYLTRTGHLYPKRDVERLYEGPWVIRPMRRLVEYGRAV